MNFFNKIQENEDIDEETKKKMENTKKDIDDMMGELPDMEEMKQQFQNNMPNLANLQDNLRNLFNGKIGSLAKEMAEEIADDFKDLIDENDVQDPKDVIKKLMKNQEKSKN